MAGESQAPQASTNDAADVIDVGDVVRLAVKTSSSRAAGMTLCYLGLAMMIPSLIAFVVASGDCHDDVCAVQHATLGSVSAPLFWIGAFACLIGGIVWSSHGDMMSLRKRPPASAATSAPVTPDAAEPTPTATPED